MIRRRLLPAAFLVFAAAGADPVPSTTPLLSPEALIPSDAGMVLRGAGLERIQSQIDAFCNRFPCALATRLRQGASGILSRPWLVAADGTRPWAIVFPRTGTGTTADPVFLLPVEDAEALRQAVASSMPGAQVRVLQGYALVGRDAVLLDRLAHPEAGGQAPGISPTEDLTLRVGAQTLQDLAASRLKDLPPPAAETARALLAQTASIEAAFAFGEEGLRVTLRLKPVAGSRLEAVLARQSAHPVRWLGLASEGAAVALETHLDPEASGACLRLLERLKPSTGGKVGALLSALWDGEACLTCFRTEAGWAGQVVSRASDPERAQALMEGTLWADGSAFPDPWLERIWTCRRGPWIEGEPRLRRLTLDAEPPEGAGPEAALSLPLAASAGEDLLVATVGPDCEERLVKTAGPLARKMETRVSPATARLLALASAGTAAGNKAGGNLGNLWLLASPRHARLLLARLDGKNPEPPAVEAASLAACLRCAEGGVELNVLLPGEVLADLPGMERILWNLLAGGPAKGVLP